MLKISGAVGSFACVWIKQNLNLDKTLGGENPRKERNRDA
jgi:hypothetical protein